jgi:hypothetical protein
VADSFAPKSPSLKVECDGSGEEGEKEIYVPIELNPMVCSLCFQCVGSSSVYVYVCARYASRPVGTRQMDGRDKTDRKRHLLRTSLSSHG